MTSHPSSLALVQFSVDDLAPTARAEVAQHLTACSICEAKVADLRAARSALLAQMPPTAFAAKVRARRSKIMVVKKRRVIIGSLATAVAAAAVFAFLLRPLDRTGWKGAGLAVHRQRAGKVHVLSADEGIQAGDGLRIVVTLQRPELVSAWFVDAHGRVDRLTDGPLSLDSGEHALPNSGIVEKPCIDLWVVAVLDASVDERVEANLRKAVSGGLPAGDGWLPAGALVQALRCE